MLSEPNNTISTANLTTLIPGVAGVFDATGTIGDVLEGDPNSDVDLLQVELNAGDRLTIDIDTTSSSLEDSSLLLFDASGNELAWSDNDSAPGEDDWGWDPYIDFTALQSGTYYIGVSGNDNVSYDPVTGTVYTPGYYTGDYNIQLILSPSTILEPNNTIATATLTTLSPGVAGVFDATGTIGDVSEGDPGSDIDLLQIELNAGDWLTIDVDSTDSLSSLGDSYLRLFDANGNELAWSDNDFAPGEDYGWGGDSYIDFTASQAGTYYIGVSGWGNSDYNPVTGECYTPSYYTGGYSLQLNLSPTTTILGTANSETLRGTRGRDSISGFGGNDNIAGLGGSDSISGGLGQDRISGGTGNDTIGGDHGNDRLFGQEGADEIQGGYGNDVICGEAVNIFDYGNDRLFGGFGNDRILGGNGQDVIEGGNGNDRLYGEGSSDEIYGGHGNDVIYGGDNDYDYYYDYSVSENLFGGAGNDRIFGDTGDDIIWGENGNDRLDGGDGSDSLNGGAGNDLLTGSVGSWESWYYNYYTPDSLTGGAGRDIFALENLVTNVQTESYVIITDLNFRLDTIRLSGSAADYYVDNYESAGSRGATLYFDNGDVMMQEVAVFQNISRTLNLNSRVFQFI